MAQKRRGRATPPNGGVGPLRGPDASRGAHASGQPVDCPAVGEPHERGAVGPCELGGPVRWLPARRESSLARPRGARPVLCLRRAVVLNFLKDEPQELAVPPRASKT